MTPMTGRRDRRAQELRSDEILADWADLAGRARRPAEAPTRPAVGIARVVAGVSVPMVLALALIVVVGSLVPRRSDRSLGVGGDPSAVPSADAPADCPVTAPNGLRGDAWPATPLDHGQDGLFTALPPAGIIRPPVGAAGGDGVVWHDTLFALRAPAVGPLGVSGRRLGAPASASPADTILVQYPDGTTGDRALRVDLGFPGEGCWELTAQAGASALRWVVRVERPEADGPAPCPVTPPNGAHTDAWPASDLDHGEGGLFTVLWPGGVVMIPVSGVDRDGVGWMKFLFQRSGTAEGGLSITGRRLDAAGGGASVLAAEIPDGYGASGIQATSLGFDSEGCWEVTARSGSATLTFVTWVEVARRAVR